MQNHFPPVPAFPSSEEQALSIALAQSVADQAAWQAARASGSQHQSVLKRSAGEALSKQLWQDGSLDYGDVITDGFYDIFGDFPEVCEGPHEFPSLEHLRKVRTGAGDVREVVVVDHELDQGLLQVEEMLSEAMADANPQDVPSRIRVVAHVVADRFGGTYDSESALERFWQASSAAEKRRNRSAVLLLCRLEVGSLRHRALLFKVLADAVKVQCKLIRGQTLCGAESAANVLVKVDGREHVVDLVFDPGRLYTQDQYAALVQLRRTRGDSWHHPSQPPATRDGGGAGVETSAVSASSTSSAGTPAGTTAGITLTTSTSGGNTLPGPSSSGAGSGGSSGQPASGGGGGTLAASISVAAPAPTASVPEAPPMLHTSPRGSVSRPHMLVPPVPAPGGYSSSLPAGGTVLHGQGAAWGQAPGYGNGPGPAIAGSRVRFTITDLPKAGNAQLHGARAESRSAPAAPPPPPPQPGFGTASAPAPVQVPPAGAAAPHAGVGGDAHAAAVAPAGRHNSLPSKAKSMLDLAVTGQQHGGDGQASSSQPVFDLIRLDSEPLPDSVLHHTAADSGGALAPPERSGTPTGPGPSLRTPSIVTNRRQNSLDHNGWVKFSGSFTRSKDDGKTLPWAPHPGGGGLGPSPLGPAAPAGGDRGAPPGSVSGSTAPPTPHPVGAQSLELSTSFQSLMPVQQSPEGTRPGSSIGSGSVAAAGGSSGTAESGGAAPAPQATPGAGLTAASAFANFRLPSDLSAAAVGDLHGGARMADGAGGGPAALAARSTGGSGGLPVRTSHAGSELNLTKAGAAQPPKHHSGPQHLPSQQHQQPQQTRPSVVAASPFQAMQMGFAANMPPPALASAFGVVQQPQPPSQQQQHGAVSHTQPLTQMQQKQQRPPQAPAGGVSGGAAANAVPVPLPRMGSLQYAGLPQAPSPPQPASLQSQQQPVRQLAAISHDSAHKLYGPGNGSGAAAGTNGAAAYYTPPPKSTDGAGGNGGSKAPSPALSTPFTALTASTAQSTPPGSAPAESVPFADLSPFNIGEALTGCGSGRRDDRPGERPQQEREQRLQPECEREQQREREQRDWERDRERERERERQLHRDRSRAQAFFADLSPFNTASGAAGGGSGNAAPSQQQPIVEMPSSDNSREATPRVSLTNLGDSQGPGPSSGGGGSALAVVGGGAEGMALDLSRVSLSGPAAGQPGSMQQHQQQMQMQQAFGAMAAMGHAAGAQQLPHHLIMSYYTAAAMQGNPYMYMQPQVAMAAAAAAAGIMGPQAQGYNMQGQSVVGGQGMQGWQRQMYDPSWANTWAAAVQQQQSNQQFMLHAYLQQEQQRQQQQARTAGAVGPSAPPAGPAALPAGAPRMSLTSGGPQLALPPSTQPQVQLQQVTQQQQAQPPPPPQHPSPPGQQPTQRLQQQPVDLAHEMTLPSRARLERSQVGGGSQDAGAGAGAGPLSPLGLQPSLSVSMPLPPSYRDLEIPPEELTFQNRIGIGSYGEVYRGTWRGTEVAIKRFLEQNLSPVTIKEFRDEVMIMSKLRHPNIVLFMGAVTQSNHLAIVTQFVARGSLFRMLHRTKEVLDPRRRLSMALDIAKGMEYLHNCKPVLVHRDLKSPNLLVDKDYTIKVCDFGLSQVKMNTYLTAKSQGGSPAWMAPEILRGEPCDEKSDVFSFGVILYELVTGKEPWEDLNPMQVVGAVGFSGRRMSLPTDLEPAVTALIQSCWATSPRERPSFSQVLATMTAWKELRPTAAVIQRQQEAAARARQQRAAAS
ncbi:hypothetical protein PLESTB_000452300 [Pleodorina starrii]|uniref:non-specific serine/threonine protein kinase n=1 Tax=Pleodorina starrii TaxID=330485 RepID=A0A9W6BF21_9CHLO|nr:hypothetical protein PLESTM_000753700 [Pleodorina starrii]GLC50972.1 hypothetical protein PLESTB_000452300 [Pleodorina starrii]